jgi:hypothetical protein
VIAKLNHFQIRAKKPTWSMGSSFPLKKAIKALPKTKIDDDELIDEHSLLTEDDLKKPQLPVGTVNKPSDFVYSFVDTSISDFGTDRFYVISPLTDFMLFR